MGHKSDWFLTSYNAVCYLVLFSCCCFVMCTTSRNAVLKDTGNNDFVVLASGDTLSGQVSWQQSGGTQNLFKKVLWTNHYGDKKRFSQKELLAFRINGIDYERFFLLQSNTKIALVNPRYEMDSERGECYFLRRLSKGHLSHYQLEWREQGAETVFSMDLFLKSQDTFLIRANQGVFGLKTKVLLQYFSDCPQLRSEISTKQFHQARQIVFFYNEFCR